MDVGGVRLPQKRTNPVGEQILGAPKCGAASRWPGEAEGIRRKRRGRRLRTHCPSRPVTSHLGARGAGHGPPEEHTPRWTAASRDATLTWVRWPIEAPRGPRGAGPAAEPQASFSRGWLFSALGLGFPWRVPGSMSKADSGGGTVVADAD